MDPSLTPRNETVFEFLEIEKSFQKFTHLEFDIVVDSI